MLKGWQEGLSKGCQEALSRVFPALKARPVVLAGAGISALFFRCHRFQLCHGDCACPD